MEGSDRYAAQVLIPTGNEEEVRRRLASVGVSPAEVRKDRAKRAQQAPVMVEAPAVASIGLISAEGVMSAGIEARAVACLGVSELRELWLIQWRR